MLLFLFRRRAQQCYNVIYCESEILVSEFVSSNTSAAKTHLLFVSKDGNADKYEFPRSKVKIVKRLDSGAFGEVFLARILVKINNKSLPDVAVKTLRGK